MGDEIVGASAESRHGVLEQGERAGEGGGGAGKSGVQVANMQGRIVGMKRAGARCT